MSKISFNRLGCLLLRGSTAVDLPMQSAPLTSMASQTFQNYVLIKSYVSVNHTTVLYSIVHALTFHRDATINIILYSTVMLLYSIVRTRYCPLQLTW